MILPLSTWGTMDSETLPSCRPTSLFILSAEHGAAQTSGQGHALTEGSPTVTQSAGDQYLGPAQ